MQLLSDQNLMLRIKCNWILIKFLININTNKYKNKRKKVKLYI